jgi:hypothetical protein
MQNPSLFHGSRRTPAGHKIFFGAFIAEFFILSVFFIITALACHFEAERREIAQMVNCR